MTTKRKSAKGKLRITQVHSKIGNQERIKRVLTDGLGLGRIGASVVLPDNPYTRGMLAKVAHIVRFEEVAAKEASGDSLPASEGGSGGHPGREGGRAGEASSRRG
jgi:large subunit ribosomal protein L30